MAQQLSSLRVVADIDTSAYVRGMSAKIAADKEGAASARAVAAELAKIDAASTTASTALVRLSRGLMGGYSSGQDFSRMINSIGGALQKGAIDAQRAGLLVEAAVQKYGLMADASQVAARGYAALVPIVNSVNRSLEDQAKAAADAERAMRSVVQVASAGDVIGRMMAPSGAQSARASAQAFGPLFAEEDARASREAAAAASDYAARADRLLRTIDPAYAAQQRFNAEMMEADDLFTAGAITLDRYEQAVSAATAKINGMAQAQEHANEIARLRAQSVAEATQASIADSFGYGSMSPRASTAGATVSALMEQARAEDQLQKEMAETERGLVALRAAYNPLLHAEALQKERIDLLNTALSQGIIKLKEHADGVAWANHAYDVVKDTVARTGNNVSLTTHQFTNLGYQINDIATMLAAGSSPFQILATQGGQVLQILQQGRGGVAGSLKDIGNALLGLLTPTNIAFGAITVGSGLALASIIKLTSAQVEMERVTSGVGRGAGITAQQFDAMAQSAARASHVSNQAARNTLGALVGTGRIQAPIAQQVTNRARDFAATTGLQAAEANRLLAESFADPTRGAERLNEVLGGLDARTMAYIRSLQSAGSLQQAQAVLLTSVLVPGIRNAAEVTSIWTQAWERLQAGASNAFEAIGRGIQRVTGSGDSPEELQRQLELVRQRLQGVQAFAQSALGQLPIFAQHATQQLALLNAEMERLQRRSVEVRVSSEGAADAARNAARARDSRQAVEVAERTVDPRIAEVRRLRNEYELLDRQIREEQQGFERRFSGTGGYAMDAQQLEQAMQARARIRRQIGQMTGGSQDIFDNEGRIASEERVQRSLTTTNDLIRQRAEAERLTRNAQRSGNEADLRAAAIARERLRIMEEGAQAGDRETQTVREGIAARQESEQIDREVTNARVERRRATQDNIEQTRTETRVIGESAAEQERARTEFQLYNDARREYRRAGRSVPQEEIEEYRQLAQAVGRARQEQERRRVMSQARYDRGLVGLSEEDVKIAQQLRTIYGDDIPAALASTEAAYIRLTDTMRSVNDLFRDSFGGFFRDLATGTSAADAFRNALSRIAGQLADMAAKQLFSAAFGGSGGIAGGGFNILGLFGLGGGGGTPMFPVHPIFAHGGATIGASGGYYAGGFSPQLWQHAPRYQSGHLASDEIAAVLHRNETVLTEQQARRAAIMSRIGMEVLADNRGAGPAQINFAPQLTIAMPEGASEEDGQRFGAAAAQQLQGMFRNLLAEEMRVGGILNPT